MICSKALLIPQEIQEPTSDLGEILVSLLYNENLHRLTVTVVETRGLKVNTNYSHKPPQCVLLLGY